MTDTATWVTRQLDELFGGLRPTLEPQEQHEPTMAERLVGHDPEILEAVQRYQAQEDERIRVRAEQQEAFQIIELITAATGLTSAEVQQRLENSPEVNASFRDAAFGESPVYDPAAEAAAAQAKHLEPWDAAAAAARAGQSALPAEIEARHRTAMGGEE